LITDIAITGRTGSGGLVNRQDSGLSSSAISCLANGGLVAAPPSAGTPITDSPVAGQPPAGTPVANSPVASQPPPALPRAGIGSAQDSGVFGSDPWTIAGMSIAAVSAFLGALLLARRGRTRGEDV
jgi:hypothetical protein